MYRKLITTGANEIRAADEAEPAPDPTPVGDAARPDAPRNSPPCITPRQNPARSHAWKSRQRFISAHSALSRAREVPWGGPTARCRTGRPDGTEEALRPPSVPRRPSAALPLCSSYPQCNMTLLAGRCGLGRARTDCDGRCGRPATAARFEGDGRRRPDGEPIRSLQRFAPA